MSIAQFDLALHVPIAVGAEKVLGGWTAKDVAAFVNAAAPAVIGGLLALITAIILFILQQRAERGALVRARQDSAFDQLVQNVRAMNDLAVAWGDASQEIDLAPALEQNVGAWQFIWHLRKRETAVGSWVIDQMQTAADVFKVTPRGSTPEISSVFSHMLGHIVAWRAGELGLRWFRRNTPDSRIVRPDKRKFRWMDAVDRLR